MASFTKSSSNYIIKIGTSTNIGGGKTNQDRVSNFSFVSKGQKCEMIIVLDGHGSLYNNGERWSNLTLEHARHHFNEHCDSFIDNPINFFERWCEKTNADISPQISSGGTTLTVGIFMDETAFFCILGDSDVILFSNQNNLLLDLVTVTDTLTGTSGQLLPSSLDETCNCLSLAANHTPGNKIEHSIRLPGVEHYYQLQNFTNVIFSDVVPDKAYFKNVKDEYATVISKNSLTSLSMTRSLGNNGITHKKPTIMQVSLAGLTSEWGCFCLATDGIHDNWVNINDPTLPGRPSLHEFVMHDTCISALSEEDGATKCAESLIQRNSVYAKRNFGDNSDNSSVALVYIKKI